MTPAEKTSDSSTSPQVVGTIPTPQALARALTLKPGAVDLLELRVDHFVGNLDLLRRALPRLRIPLIITVRHPREGGLHRLGRARRRDLYSEFLRAATWIDVELRSAEELAATVQAARTAGVKVILSAHHFHSTPGLPRLERLLEAAAEARADLFKVATRTDSIAEVKTLLRLLIDHPRSPMSVMGMGAKGRMTRLLFAALGSRLNYGFLDKVQVPGQWPAPLLKRRLAELRLE
ncbi:MAG: type I 3-dehydroquinate dehydratase [Verrucomicrobiota bacterium]|nr:type I 3-dehydroquinate dehydratase [Verrucomicrobiota bacterium]